MPKTHKVMLETAVNTQQYADMIRRLKDFFEEQEDYDQLLKTEIDAVHEFERVTLSTEAPGHMINLLFRYNGADAYIATTFPISANGKNLSENPKVKFAIAYWGAAEHEMTLDIICNKARTEAKTAMKKS